MIGRYTEPVRLKAHTLTTLDDISQKATNTAKYFSKFLVPGALKCDDGWFDPLMLGGSCTCTEQQRHNYGAPCCVCKSHFAANRIAEDYAQHIKLTAGKNYDT